MLGLHEVKTEMAPLRQIPEKMEVLEKAHEQTRSDTTQEKKMRTWLQDHSAQVRYEERKMLLPGQPMLDLYENGGQEAGPVHTKLLEWLASYRQTNKGPDLAADILRSEVFLVPLARDASGAVTAHQVCVKFAGRGARDDLCSIFGRWEAWRKDETWRRVRV